MEKPLLPESIHLGKFSLGVTRKCRVFLRFTIKSLGLYGEMIEFYCWLI